MLRNPRATTDRSTRGRLEDTKRARHSRDYRTPSNPSREIFHHTCLPPGGHLLFRLTVPPPPRQAIIILRATEEVADPVALADPDPVEGSEISEAVAGPEILEDRVEILEALVVALADLVDLADPVDLAALLTFREYREDYNQTLEYTSYTMSRNSRRVTATRATRTRL